MVWGERPGLTLSPGSPNFKLFPRVIRFAKCIFFTALDIGNAKNLLSNQTY